jgi:hypothetical protein
MATFNFFLAADTINRSAKYGDFRSTTTADTGPACAAADRAFPPSTEE